MRLTLPLRPLNSADERIGLKNVIMDPKHPLPRPKTRPPLEVAAQSASTSYRTVLPAAVLGDALRTRKMPKEFEAHIGTLLEEAPLSMLAQVVEQIHAEDALQPEQVWSNMRSLARELKVIRDCWGKTPVD